MSDEAVDYDTQREELLQEIERDEEEIKAAVQELASVASEAVQELTTAATDKVQELATVASDTARDFADAASEKLEVLDVSQHIRESPVRWLVAAFIVGAWLGSRSNRPVFLTDRRSLR